MDILKPPRSGGFFFQAVVVPGRTLDTMEPTVSQVQSWAARLDRRPPLDERPRGEDSL